MASATTQTRHQHTTPAPIKARFRPSRPAAKGSKALAQDLLRDLAFVLNATRRISQEIREVNAEGVR